MAFFAVAVQTHFWRVFQITAQAENYPEQGNKKMEKKYEKIN